MLFRSTGEKHSRWQGGISGINGYLRSVISTWYKDSLRRHNFKCVLTNRSAKIVHHLFSFSKIVRQAHIELNLEIKPKVYLYNICDLHKLEEKVLSLHYSHGFGVPLIKQLHDMFHREYGLYDFSPDDFSEFTTRYKTGEFDNDIAA